MVMVVAGRAQHRGALDLAFVSSTAEADPFWKSHTPLASGDGVPQDGLPARVVEEDGKAMAGAKKEEGS
jgi:hypothetical protein